VGSGRVLDYMIVADTSGPDQGSHQVVPVVEVEEDANIVAAAHNHQALGPSSLGWHPAAAPVGTVQPRRQRQALKQAAC